VTSLSEQVQVCVEVEPLWVFWALAALTQAVVEVVVDMGACEVNRLFLSIRCGEVPRILAGDDKPTELSRHYASPTRCAGRAGRLCCRFLPLAEGVARSVDVLKQRPPAEGLPGRR